MRLHLRNRAWVFLLTASPRCAPAPCQRGIAGVGCGFQSTGRKGAPRMSRLASEGSRGGAVARVREYVDSGAFEAELRTPRQHCFVLPPGTWPWWPTHGPVFVLD